MQIRCACDEGSTKKERYIEGRLAPDDIIKSQKNPIFVSKNILNL